MNYKNILTTTALFSAILITLSFNPVYGVEVWTGLNLTTPQQISLPVVIIKDPFNPHSFSIEPGLKGQKAHYIHWYSPGSGPAAWNYKVSTLYMTKDTCGLRRGQLLLGGEIGGYFFDLSGSIGVYGSVAGKSNGSHLFISASIGFVDILHFLKTISKVPQ